MVISANTRRLTGGLFEYRELGTVSLKGFTESVPAWELMGTSEAESRFEALRAKRNRCRCCSRQRFERRSPHDIGSCGCAALPAAQLRPSTSERSIAIALRR